MFPKAVLAFPFLVSPSKKKCISGGGERRLKLSNLSFIYLI